MDKVREKLSVSERRACRVLSQARSTQRRRAILRDDEDALTGRIIQMASCYGRYGYGRIHALLGYEGWDVNHKRVERIWRREGLKVPKRQPKRGRLWLNDGSCVRLRSTHKDHVWSYDFIMDRTRDGRPIRMLTILDEYTRECLAIHAARSLRSTDVLNELFLDRGIPEHIRSDNGSEFTVEAVCNWLETLNIKPLYIEPGSPRENGYIESFHDKLRDELLSRELFDTLYEAKALLSLWRSEHNTIRPHSSLDYRPPAPEAFTWPSDPKKIGALHTKGQLARLAC